MIQEGAAAAEKHGARATYIYTPANSWICYDTKCNVSKFEISY